MRDDHVLIPSQWAAGIMIVVTVALSDDCIFDSELV